MKIICIDNFDRESVSDSLVADNINEYYGKIIVEFLREKLSGSTSPSYFELVEDAYKLYTFEP